MFSFPFLHSARDLRIIILTKCFTDKHHLIGRCESSGKFVIICSPTVSPGGGERLRSQSSGFLQNIFLEEHKQISQIQIDYSLPSLNMILLQIFQQISISTLLDIWFCGSRIWMLYSIQGGRGSETFQNCNKTLSKCKNTCSIGELLNYIL